VNLTKFGLHSQSTPMTGIYKSISASLRSSSEAMKLTQHVEGN